MSFLVKYRPIVPLVLLAAALFATPAHASFPGKNGRIAFVFGPDIYTMSVDGSDVRQLTAFTDDNSAFWESWSADRQTVGVLSFPCARLLRATVDHECRRQRSAPPAK